MTDQNSGIERQIRPDEAMQLLGVKKDAYGDRRKFLGIEHHRDREGKIWLLPEDFDRMKALGEYIAEHGKMEGFADSNRSELAVSHAASIEATAPEVQNIPLEDDLDKLIRAAAELKGQQLVMPELVVKAIADRMTYEDLPDDVKQKVDSVRNAASPKHPSQLAEQLLSRYRTQSREKVA